MSRRALPHRRQEGVEIKATQGAVFQEIRPSAEDSQHGRWRPNHQHGDTQWRRHRFQIASLQQRAPRVHLGLLERRGGASPSAGNERERLGSNLQNRLRRPDRKAYAKEANSQKYPDAFDEVYVDAIITCTGRASGAPSGATKFGTAAVWHGFTIGGFAHRDDPQGY